MGHAAHFLQRLDRVRDHEVELALTLYRDEDLLRAVLAAATIPDAAERVAISLDDAELGPFVVVTRTGKFVTCLGRGMSVGGLPIISRERIEVAGGRVERMRERLGRMRRLIAEGAMGETAVAFERMQRRGPRFSREAARTLLRVHPIIAPDTLLALTGTIDAARKSFERVQRMRLDRLHPIEERLVVSFGEMVWGTQNLLVLASPADLRTNQPGLLDDIGTAPFAWALSSAVWGASGGVLRGSWACAQLGRGALAVIKERRTQPAALGTRMFLELAIGAVGCASTKARAEARKSLCAPWVGREDMREGFDLFMREWTKLIDLALDKPEVADAAALLGMKMLAFGVRTGTQPTEENAQEIPDDVARAFSTTLPISVLDHSEGAVALHQMLAFSLPWLASAKAEELFLPQVWTDRLVRDHRTVEAVREWLDPLVVRKRARPQPLVRAATPGRNDPCPCGSGVKHKRCCGRAT